MALRTHAVTLGLTMAAGLFAASQPAEAQQGRDDDLYRPASRQPFSDWTAVPLAVLPE